MYDLSKVNKLDVAQVYEQLEKAWHCIENLKGTLYFVEKNQTADDDCCFMYSVQEWLLAKQDYLLKLHNVTESDLELTKKAE